EKVIPWREVQRVEVRDHTFSTGRARVTLKAATVVFVSQVYYDKVLYIGSFFSRGPYWSDKFVDDGTSRGIVIAPEFLSVSAAELSEAITLRWKGSAGGSNWSITDLGEQSAASGRPVPAHAGSPTGSALPVDGVETLKLALPMVVMAAVAANAVGLWETSGQARDRQRREAWAAEERQRAEERRMHDEKWKTFWDDFDKSMSRIGSGKPEPPQK
ncbi:MAG TPA: hypothetical protein PK264_12760, partial [Hyphomicrobiaceae bacterium]|nr:hypothetical protein [Hyphomicrobiaceae bacterium]